MAIIDGFVISTRPVGALDERTARSCQRAIDHIKATLDTPEWETALTAFQNHINNTHNPHHDGNVLEADDALWDTFYQAVQGLSATHPTRNDFRLWCLANPLAALETMRRVRNTAMHYQEGSGTFNAVPTYTNNNLLPTSPGRPQISWRQGLPLPSRTAATLCGTIVLAFDPPTPRNDEVLFLRFSNRNGESLSIIQLGGNVQRGRVIPNASTERALDEDTVRREGMLGLFDLPDMEPYQLLKLRVDVTDENTLSEDENAAMFHSAINTLIATADDAVVDQIQLIAWGYDAPLDDPTTMTVPIAAKEGLWFKMTERTVVAITFTQNAILVRHQTNTTTTKTSCYFTGFENPLTMWELGDPAMQFLIGVDWYDHPLTDVELAYAYDRLR